MSDGHDGMAMQHTKSLPVLGVAPPVAVALAP
jgi:hypothetical protein